MLERVRWKFIEIYYYSYLQKVVLNQLIKSYRTTNCEINAVADQNYEIWNNVHFFLHKELEESPNCEYIPNHSLLIIILQNFHLYIDSLK